VASAERGVVRCTDFRHTESTWLFWTVCAWNEVEGYVMWDCISHDFLLSGKIWRKSYCLKYALVKQWNQPRLTETFDRPSVSSETWRLSRSWTISAISSRSLSPVNGVTSTSNFSRACSQLSGSSWKPE